MTRMSASTEQSLEVVKLKFCTRCCDDLELSKFRTLKTGKIYSWCIECTREDNRIRMRETGYVSPRRLANQIWLTAYKAERGCSRCPENHPAALDFHHQDRSIKLGQVNRFLSNSWQLIVEVSKCIILCANCHRKEHHAHPQRKTQEFSIRKELLEMAPSTPVVKPVEP